MTESQTKYQALSRQEALAAVREVEELVSNLESQFNEILKAEKEKSFELGLAAANARAACGSGCSCNN